MSRGIDLKHALNSLARAGFVERTEAGYRVSWKVRQTVKAWTVEAGRQHAHAQ